MQDMEFGNRLYHLRRKAGLSQAQLGEKAGVSSKAVSKWENGQAKRDRILFTGWRTY